MAITRGAKKAHRSSQRKRVYNVRRKKELHDAVQVIRKHVATGETKEATALMAKAYKAIDKAAKRGVIKPNTAARKKSRLMGAIHRQIAKST
jgi:small subunit ribosomal protein S20